MKKLNLLILFVFGFIAMNAQNMKSEDAQECKKMKLIIGATENGPGHSKYLVKALNDNWNFSEIEGTMEKNEAIEFTDENEETHYTITFASSIIRSKVNEDEYYEYYAVGVNEGIALYIDGRKELFIQFPTILNSCEDPYPYVHYSVMQMLYFVNALEQEKASSVLWSRGLIEENAKLLKGKKLIINSELVDNDLIQNKVEEILKGIDYEYVSIDEYEQILQSKNGDNVVLVDVPFTNGTITAFLYYLVDPATGMIYGIEKDKPWFALNLRFTIIPVGNNPDRLLDKSDYKGIAGFFEEANETGK